MGCLQPHHGQAAREHPDVRPLRRHRPGLAGGALHRPPGLRPGARRLGREAGRGRLLRRQRDDVRRDEVGDPATSSPTTPTCSTTPAACGPRRWPRRWWTARASTTAWSRLRARVAQPGQGNGLHGRVAVPGDRSVPSAGRSPPATHPAVRAREESEMTTGLTDEARFQRARSTASTGPAATRQGYGRARPAGPGRCCRPYLALLMIGGIIPVGYAGQDLDGEGTDPARSDGGFGGVESFRTVVSDFRFVDTFTNIFATLAGVAADHDGRHRRPGPADPRQSRALRLHDAVRLLHPRRAGRHRQPGPLGLPAQPEPVAHRGLLERAGHRDHQAGRRDAEPPARSS